MWKIHPVFFRFIDFLQRCFLFASSQIESFEDLLVHCRLMVAKSHDRIVWGHTWNSCKRRGVGGLKWRNKVSLMFAEKEHVEKREKSIMPESAHKSVVGWITQNVIKTLSRQHLAIWYLQNQQKKKNTHGNYEFLSHDVGMLSQSQHIKRLEAINPEEKIFLRLFLSHPLTDDTYFLPA